MKVTIEFGEPPDDPVPDAVWIIDTPPNRAWFAAQANAIDANSAVFRDDSDPIAIIEAVFEHHPHWTEIEVRGALLTPEVEAGIQLEAVAVALSGDTFRLTRP